MPVNRFLTGKRGGGYIRMILVAGFSGIVDIIWGVGTQMMSVKSNGGKHLKDMYHRFEITVFKEILVVDPSNVRRFCIGHMIVESYKFKNFFRGLQKSNISQPHKTPCKNNGICKAMTPPCCINAPLFSYKTAPK